MNGFGNLNQALSLMLLETFRFMEEGVQHKVNYPKIPVDCILTYLAIFERP